MIALDLKDQLHDHGAKVTIASTLDNAMAKLEDGDCDAAVVDHHLGPEVADPLYTELKNRDIPFIIATGANSTNLAEQNVPVVDKPTSEGALISALESVLRREPVINSQVPSMCDETTKVCT